MKILIFFILFFIPIFPQIKLNDIEQLLLLQGKSKEEAKLEAVYLYNKFEQQNKPNIFTTTLYSSLSGFSLGFHESYTFGYKYYKWLPKFMQTWYEWRPNTDLVFGKIFTFQKVFRDIDYAFDRIGWNNWKKIYNVKNIISFNTLLAFITHTGIKYTMATMIRDRMKHDKWFYSFDIELVFGNILTDIIK